MSKQDDIQKQLKKQEEEVYGDSYTEGDHEVFDDTEEMVEDVTGDEPDEDKPYSLADEVEHDEEDLKVKPINDYQQEPDDNSQPETEIEKLEKEDRNSDKKLDK
jgi:hypothetical protein